MKSPGSPILGDSLYGGTESETMFLYAWKIQFTYQQFAYFNRAFQLIQIRDNPNNQFETLQSASDLFRFSQNHRIAIAEKAVFLFHRMTVNASDMLHARKRADKHQQG